MNDADSLKEISTVEQVFEMAREASAEVVTVPSGLTFKLVKPMPLGSFVIYKQTRKVLSAVAESKSDEDKSRSVNDYVSWLESLFTWAFVSPRFSAAPLPGEIGLPNLLLQDAIFIYRWLDCVDGAASGVAPLVM
jgi:hypothetical protein